MSINTIAVSTAVILILTLTWGSQRRLPVRGGQTTPAVPVSGWLRGGARTPALIRVYEENADNTKGTLLIGERWIKRNERLRVTSARGRFINDFKLLATDSSWATDAHTGCQGSRQAATAVP